MLLKANEKFGAEMMTRNTVKDDEEKLRTLESYKFDMNFCLPFSSFYYLQYDNKRKMY